MPQPHVAEARREFEHRFKGANFVATIQRHAIGGELRKSRVRSVAWKMFLGSLSSSDGAPATSWARESARRRAKYDELLQRMMSTPAEKSADAETVKPQVIDPLSNAADSPWQEFFRDSELLDVIKLDLSRTYPDLEFFQSEQTQRQMLHILFVWSKLNANTSYRQGMNELLAPLLLLVAAEAIPHVQSEADASDLFACVLDERYIEHDTYDLFERIMQKMITYFVVQPPAKRPAAGSGAASASAPPAEPPIVVKCNQIHHSLLATRDPQLYQHLQSIQILPQLYALRWVRLLCTREFVMENVFILWDAIFAASEDFALLDFVCVAMVLFVRPFLMDSDNSGALRRLLRYPPVEDVHALVEKALRLQNPATARADYEALLQKQREMEMQAQAAAAAARAAAMMARGEGGSSSSSSSASFASSSSSGKGTSFLSDPLSSIKRLGNNLLGNNDGNNAASSPSSASASATGSGGAAARPRSVLSHLFNPSTPSTASARQQPSSSSSQPPVPFAVHSALVNKFEHLELTAQSMSVRLEIICQVLQSNLMAVASTSAGKPEQPEEEGGFHFDQNACLQCLAELKQIKDVLGGRLDSKDIAAPPQVHTVTAAAQLPSTVATMAAQTSSSSSPSSSDASLDSSASFDGGLPSPVPLTDADLDFEPPIISYTSIAASSSTPFASSSSSSSSASVASAPAVVSSARVESLLSQLQSSSSSSSSGGGGGGLGGGSLFGDEPDEKRLAAASSLFGDDDDADSASSSGAFAASSSASASANGTATGVSAARAALTKSKPATKPAAAKSSLFADDPLGL